MSRKNEYRKKDRIKYYSKQRKTKNIKKSDRRIYKEYCKLIRMRNKRYENE
jgi:hypothetical protein